MKGILLDEDRDIQVSNGAMVIGDIANQNIELLIISEKGEIREAPLRGVGIRRFVDDEDPAMLLQAIRNELATEKMSIDTIGIS
jgi:hypothetical protein